MDSNSVLSCSDAEEITVIAEPSQTGLSVFFCFIYLGLRHFNVFFKLTQRCSTALNLAYLNLVSHCWNYRDTRTQLAVSGHPQGQLMQTLIVRF